MSAKFRARVLLNWCLMNCCETGQSVLLHKYVHDCFAISVLKPLQITVVSCHIYRKSLRSTTLCSMRTRQTNHCKQSVLQSLRLKYTAPKNYAFQSLSQIHPNHITSSCQPGRYVRFHRGIPVDQVAIKALGQKQWP